MLLRKKSNKLRLMSLVIISALLIPLIAALNSSKVYAATKDDIVNDELMIRTGITVGDGVLDNLLLTTWNQAEAFKMYTSLNLATQPVPEGATKGLFDYFKGAQTKTLSVPYEIKEADSKEMGDYYKAELFNDMKDYYNAVFYAGKAINAGYDRQVVSLLNNASTKLLVEADADEKANRLNDAVIKYRILMNTYGVPQNIKDTATKNESNIMVDFNAAKYFSANGDYFNAVHYASVAEVFGLRLEEVTTFLNNAAAHLSAVADKKANNKQYNEAVSDYQKLIDAYGVPETIKQAAQSNLNNLTK
ncbi:hypothetical protein [Bacillus toyonensis]|uniref:hypothetical protein n=1 Tax=Bacillus toyonensis TaxID=155322 RepID=UPI002E200AEC|nr:hypothetical protein [Bacillus toyonensis]